MYTLTTLPLKFHPYLLGSPSCSADFGIKQEIDQAFKKGLVSIKENYIFDAGKWILKTNSSNPLLIRTTETLIYRVRKADKLRRHIRQNQLQEDLVIPKKFLYWNQEENRFYVVSEKIDLSEEVVELPVLVFQNTQKSTSSGQMLRLIDGGKKRAFTPNQAKGLAELVFLGYTDLTYNNLFFDRAGKVAVIDTEPLHRKNKKSLFSSPLSWLLLDKSVEKFKMSLNDIDQLKRCCSDSAAVQEVEHVRKKAAALIISHLAKKITLTILMLFSLGLLFPFVSPLIGYGILCPVILACLLKGMNLFKDIAQLKKMEAVSNKKSAFGRVKVQVKC